MKRKNGQVYLVIAFDGRGEAVRLRMKERVSDETIRKGRGS